LHPVAAALLAVLVGIPALAPAGVAASSSASCAPHAYDPTENKEIAVTWTATAQENKCTWMIDPFQLEHEGELGVPDEDSSSEVGLDVVFQLLGATFLPHTRLSIYGDYTINRGLGYISDIVPSNHLADLGGPFDESSSSTSSGASASGSSSDSASLRSFYAINMTACTDKELNPSLCKTWLDDLVKDRKAGDPIGAAAASSSSNTNANANASSSSSSASSSSKNKLLQSYPWDTAQPLVSKKGKIAVVITFDSIAGDTTPSSTESINFKWWKKSGGGSLLDSFFGTMLITTLGGVGLLVIGCLFRGSNRNPDGGDRAENLDGDEDVDAILRRRRRARGERGDGADGAGPGGQGGAARQGASLHRIHMTTLVYRFHARHRKKLIQGLCAAEYSDSSDHLDCSVCLDSLVPESADGSLLEVKEDDMVLEDVETTSSSSSAKAGEVLPGTSTAGTVGATGTVSAAAEGCAGEEARQGTSFRVRLLPCGHLYHADCVEPWLKKNRVCPACRLDITKTVATYQRKEEYRRAVAEQGEANVPLSDEQKEEFQKIAKTKLRFQKIEKALASFEVPEEEEVVAEEQEGGGGVGGGRGGGAIVPGGGGNLLEPSAPQRPGSADSFEAIVLDEEGGGGRAGGSGDDGSGGFGQPQVDGGEGDDIEMLEMPPEIRVRGSGARVGETGGVDRVGAAASLMGTTQQQRESTQRGGAAAGPALSPPALTPTAAEAEASEWDGDGGLFVQVRVNELRRLNSSTSDS
jgi:hypothetical protein